MIDDVNTFLLNEKMYELCLEKDAPFICLAHSTDTEFIKLFDKKMFVAASVGSEERRLCATSIFDIIYVVAQQFLTLKDAELT